MERHSKSGLHLALGVVLAAGLIGQTTAQADTTVTNEIGTANLAATGSSAADETVTVNYLVTEDLSSDIYTYSYTINNPTGDTVLPGTMNQGNPEIVDTFKLGFNADAPGAYIPLSATGGLLGAVLDGDSSAGLAWFIPYPFIIAGNSNVVTFQSYLAPVLGDATAQDDNPPSPWLSTAIGGDPVPVPGVPESTSTFALLAGTLLLLPLRRLALKPCLAR